MPTPVKVKKWGDSMAVLIPSHFAKARRISVGSVIDIEPIHVVRNQRRRYKLTDLLAGFKRRHRHGEWKMDGRVGKEVW